MGQFFKSWHYFDAVRENLDLVYAPIYKPIKLNIWKFRFILVAKKYIYIQGVPQYITHFLGVDLFENWELIVYSVQSQESL